MIVPINCPEVESDRLQYTQAVASSNFTLHQELECYAYKDNPGRPLLIKAELLPHVSLAVMLFFLPLIAIIMSCFVCLVMRGDPEMTRDDEDDEEDDDFEETIRLSAHFAKRSRPRKHRSI